MKKVIKILTILIIFSLILINVSFAATEPEPTDINSFLGKTTSVTDTEKKALDSVLSIVQVIGISVATIMLIVLGIKYIVASASERAEIKKHAVVFVTGAILMFGASAIVTIIRVFVTSNLT